MRWLCGRRANISTQSGGPCNYRTMLCSQFFYILSSLVFLVSHLTSDPERVSWAHPISILYWKWERKLLPVSSFRFHNLHSSNVRFKNHTWTCTHYPRQPEKSKSPSQSFSSGSFSSRFERPDNVCVEKARDSYTKKTLLLFQLYVSSMDSFRSGSRCIWIENLFSGNCFHFHDSRKTVEKNPPSTFPIVSLSQSRRTLVFSIFLLKIQFSKKMEFEKPSYKSPCWRFFDFIQGVIYNFILSIIDFLVRSFYEIKEFIYDPWMKSKFIYMTPAWSQKNHTWSLHEK